LLGGDLSTWAGNGSHEKGLSEPYALVSEIYTSRQVTKDSFNGLVNNAVTLTIDGGFTDDTTIIHTLAAGATDVVAILNYTGTDAPVQPQNVFNLFSSKSSQGFRRMHRFPNRGSTSRDAQGLGASESAEYLAYEVFQESQEEAKVKYAELAKRGSLNVGSDDSQELISIIVGTFENLTTKDNRFVGLEGGRTVNLHVVSVTSKLNLGENVDFNMYGVLVQEIINTILNPVNHKKVEELLSPLFFEGDAAQELALKWKRIGA